MTVARVGERCSVKSACRAAMGRSESRLLGALRDTLLSELIASEPRLNRAEKLVVESV